MKLPFEFKGIWISNFGEFRPRIQDRFVPEYPKYAVDEDTDPEWVTKEELEVILNYGKIEYIDIRMGYSEEEKKVDWNSTEFPIIRIWTDKYIVKLVKTTECEITREYFSTEDRNPPTDEPSIE